MPLFPSLPEKMRSQRSENLADLFMRLRCRETKQGIAVRIGITRTGFSTTKYTHRHKYMNIIPHNYAFASVGGRLFGPSYSARCREDGFLEEMAELATNSDLVHSQSSIPIYSNDSGCSVAQLCLTLCNPVICILPGSSVHGISQAECWSGLPFPGSNENISFEMILTFKIPAVATYSCVATEKGLSKY